MGISGGAVFERSWAARCVVFFASPVWGLNERKREDTLTFSSSSCICVYLVFRGTEHYCIGKELLFLLACWVHFQWVGGVWKAFCVKNKRLRILHALDRMDTMDEQW